MEKKRGYNMYKFFVTCSLAIIAAFSVVPAGNAALDWDKGLEIKTKTSPVDVAVSADGKWTFVLTEGGKVNIYDANGKLNGTVPVDKSTTKIDASPQGDKIYAVSSKNNKVEQINIAFVEQIDIAGSPIMGKANAQVAIVVFSDFE